MIKYFYKSLRTPALQELDDFKRGTWVYAEAPTTGELALLADKFDIDPVILDDAVDEDEMPRIERDDGVSYIFVRYAFRKQNGEVDTAPLLIVFGGEYVITVSRVHLPAVDLLLRGKVPFATTQRAKLVLLILSQVSDQYDVFINQTSRQLKSIRARLRGHGITNQDLIDFVTIEDELNEFLGSLQPNNATLRRLLTGKHIPLFEEDQDIVEDLMLSNTQSMEGSKSNLKSISNIRDAYSAISANNLNRTIKILTVATVLIALPNLFFGMYGMNVRLPFQDARWTFEAILSFNLVLIAIFLLFARRKRII
jgi:magnesium transporter